MPSPICYSSDYIIGREFQLANGVAKPLVMVWNGVASRGVVAEHC